MIELKTLKLKLQQIHKTLDILSFPKIGVSAIGGLERWTWTGVLDWSTGPKTKTSVYTATTQYKPPTSIKVFQLMFNMKKYDSTFCIYNTVARIIHQLNWKAL